MPNEKADVVIAGVGAVGAIMAAELGKAGMRVIGLERGPRHQTMDSAGQDELRYFQRHDLRPDVKKTPITWRPNTRTRSSAVRVQNYGAQVGGGTVHYGAVSWRFHEDDFRVRSQTIEPWSNAMCMRVTMLNETPIASAIAGCVILLSRSKTI
jgi:gluconate 2-dehydrogenase alpha chain